MHVHIYIYIFIFAIILCRLAAVKGMNWNSMIFMHRIMYISRRECNILRDYLRLEIIYSIQTNFWYLKIQASPSPRKGYGFCCDGSHSQMEIRYSGTHTSSFFLYPALSKWFEAKQCRLRWLDFRIYSQFQPLSFHFCLYLFNFSTIIATAKQHE